MFESVSVFFPTESDHRHRVRINADRLAELHYLGRVGYTFAGEASVSGADGLTVITTLHRGTGTGND